MRNIPSFQKRHIEGTFLSEINALAISDDIGEYLVDMDSPWK